MSAAKWHREQGRCAITESSMYSRPGKAAQYRAAAAHHALAADVLEALAVPENDALFAGIVSGRITMTDSDGLPYGITKDQRAALATLARVAKEDR